MRKEVEWFVEQMEKKLKENEHKGGWEKETYEMLIALLECEVDELKWAINHHSNLGASPVHIINECADVANFVMMIADNTKRDIMKSYEFCSYNDKSV